MKSFMCENICVRCFLRVRFQCQSSSILRIFVFRGRRLNRLSNVLLDIQQLYKGKRREFDFYFFWFQLIVKLLFLCRGEFLFFDFISFWMFLYRKLQRYRFFCFFCGSVLVILFLLDFVVGVRLLFFFMGFMVSVGFWYEL